MKVLRWTVRTLGEVLITLGLLMFLFIGWQLWWTNVTANREQAATIQALEKGFGPAKTSSRSVGPVNPIATLTKVPFGQAFAIMRIPRFGADYARPVLQGTDADALSQGIGHYAGTAFPGQVGNFAVAGHRTTYGKPFSDIALLQKGDVIVVETKTSYMVYSVNRWVTVTPDQVQVIAPVPQHAGAVPTQDWMTMTSCTPPFSASHRYVVFSKLVKSIPRSDGLPASFMAVPSGTVG
jgi:sortase A